MNIISRCLVTILTVAVFSAPVSAQRGGARRPTAALPVAAAAPAVSIEETRESCTTKFMAALDAECFNPNSAGGVYSDCINKSIPELYDIMDMNLGRLVPFAELAETVRTCAPFKGQAVERWLGAKRVIETSAVRDSDECIFARQRLAAAARCYSAALAHDGNFFEFDNLMRRNCGQYPDIAQRFSRAGDIGFADLPRMLENWATMQFTNKSANWRNQIEAVFVGYIYQAKIACNIEDFELIELNHFRPDERENFLTIMRRDFIERQATGRRIYINPISIGGAQHAAQRNEEFQEAMGWRDFVAGRGPSGSARAIRDSYDVGNVYTIERVSNLGAARARLVAIVQNGVIGTTATQDALDALIITSLGGRAGGDPGIYNILSSMNDGDTFIIKQADGVCQAMRLRDKVLVRITNAEMDNTPSLHGHMHGCRELVE